MSTVVSGVSTVVSGVSTLPSAAAATMTSLRARFLKAEAAEAVNNYTLYKQSNFYYELQELMENCQFNKSRVIGMDRQINLWLEYEHIDIMCKYYDTPPNNKYIAKNLGDIDNKTVDAITECCKYRKNGLHHGGKKLSLIHI